MNVLAFKWQLFYLCLLKGAYPGSGGGYQAPGGYPSQAPGGYPGQTPGGYPGQAPPQGGFGGYNPTQPGNYGGYGQPPASGSVLNFIFIHISNLN